jgi:hypothetical protein
MGSYIQLWVTSRSSLVGAKFEFETTTVNVASILESVPPRTVIMCKSQSGSSSLVGVKFEFETTTVNVASVLEGVPPRTVIMCKSQSGSSQEVLRLDGRFTSNLNCVLRLRIGELDNFLSEFLKEKGHQILITVIISVMSLHFRKDGTLVHVDRQ